MWTIVKIQKESIYKRWIKTIFNHYHYKGGKDQGK